MEMVRLAEKRGRKFRLRSGALSVPPLWGGASHIRREATRPFVSSKGGLFWIGECGRYPGYRKRKLANGLMAGRASLRTIQLPRESANDFPDGRNAHFALYRDLGDGFAGLVGTSDCFDFGECQLAPVIAHWGFSACGMSAEWQLPSGRGIHFTPLAQSSQ